MVSSLDARSTYVPDSPNGATTHGRRYPTQGLRVIGIGFAVIAVICVARVEHVVASTMWILLSGNRWAAKVRRLSVNQQRDAERMWSLYRQTGGGKLPYLFFGIKSYRLYAWSTANRDHRMRSVCVRLLRLLWRYYLFSPTMLLLVIFATFVPIRTSSIERWSLLVIAVSGVLGMLAIAAEVIVASFRLKSWAAIHHRWPNPSPPKTDRSLAEFSAYMGCVVLAWFSALALVSVVAVTFHGYAQFPYQGPVVRQLEAVVEYTLIGLITNVWIDHTGTVSFVANVLVSTLYVTYVLMIPFAGAPERLWGKG